jgi:hypothetical protein
MQCRRLSFVGWSLRLCFSFKAARWRAERRKSPDARPGLRAVEGCPEVGQTEPSVEILQRGPAQRGALVTHSLLTRLQEPITAQGVDILDAHIAALRGFLFVGPRAGLGEPAQPPAGQAGGLAHIKAWVKNIQEPKIPKVQDLLLFCSLKA